MCRIGAGAGSSTGAETAPDHRLSNCKLTDDSAGRPRLANTDADGGRRVHQNLHQNQQQIHGYWLPMCWALQV